jgi:uncharacterized protein (DUF885 family)
VTRRIFVAAAVLALAGQGFPAAQTPGPPAAPAPASAGSASKAWVDASNANARILVAVIAKLSPEGAGRIGVDGLDEAITDFSDGFEDRAIAANRTAEAALKTALASADDQRVRQDLQIMIDAAEDNAKNVELSRSLTVPFYNVGSLVFNGVRALLDDQITPARRQAALVRLRKYIGDVPGTTPLAKRAEAIMRERMTRPGLAMPARAEIERALADSASFVDGIPELFKKYAIAGYEEPCATFTAQMALYDAFLRTAVLPRARADFRLPPALYAFALKRYGVEIGPASLVTAAHAAFDDIQKQMQTVAESVAKARGLAVTDYRDVIRELKKEQLVGDAILPHYKARLAEIEAIITREHLVTLPARPARIRLATAAETANSPAPNMRPPRMLGNTGEQGEFLLPLNVPTTDGKTLKTDDFTFAAASWTLTAHEARPGHELQFAAMLEAGVSVARALFSFNSANVEGWGLYSELVMQPYLPPDGQLIALQHRLLRAARAYLDPELQAGRITPEQALAVLTKDVVLSDGMARQEVDRYTFRAPGQATSYFYGFTKLVELRTDIEKALGPRFNPQQFHDFILSQGLLPPRLMREAIVDHYAGMP